MKRPQRALLRRARGHGLPLESLSWELMGDVDGTLHSPHCVFVAVNSVPVVLDVERALRLPEGLRACAWCPYPVLPSPAPALSSLSQLVSLLDGVHGTARQLRAALEAGPSLQAWCLYGSLTERAAAASSQALPWEVLAASLADTVAFAESAADSAFEVLSAAGPAPLFDALGVPPSSPPGGPWGECPSRFLVRGTVQGHRAFLDPGEEAVPGVPLESLLTVVSSVWGVTGRFGFEVLLVPEALAAALLGLGLDFVDCGPGSAELLPLVEVVATLACDADPFGPFADPVRLFDVARSVVPPR